MYDFAIATTTYFGEYGTVRHPEYRLRLFYDMADSIAGIKWENTKAVWVIHDDASPIQFPKLSDCGIPMQIALHPDRKTNRGNIPRCIGHAAKLADWVITADSDGLFSRDCFVRLRQLMQHFPDNKVFGLFNSPYCDTVEDRASYVLKSRLCEHGAVFQRGLWQPTRDDLGLFANFGEVGGPFPCLKPSGLQHTGTYGLNGTVDDYDEAFVQ